MDAQPAVVTVKFNKFLPYWAVLQTDLRQTYHSWVYRLWVFMAVLAAGGLLLYRVGVHKEAGMFQSAAAQCGDLFRIPVVSSRPRSAARGGAASTAGAGRRTCT